MEFNRFLSLPLRRSRKMNEEKASPGFSCPGPQGYSFLFIADNPSSGEVSHEEVAAVDQKEDG